MTNQQLNTELSVDTIVERALKPTKPFWRKVRTLGLIIGAISGAIIAAPIALPAAVITAATVAASIGGTMATVAQITVTDGNEKTTNP